MRKHLKIDTFAPKARYFHVSVYARFDNFPFLSVVCCLRSTLPFADFHSLFRSHSLPLCGSVCVCVYVYVFIELIKFSHGCDGTQSYEVSDVCLCVRIFWHDDESTPRKIRACKQTYNTRAMCASPCCCWCFAYYFFSSFSLYIHILLLCWRFGNSVVFQSRLSYGNVMVWLFFTSI